MTQTEERRRTHCTPSRPLQQSLGRRHVQMIAIGGAIGPGSPGLGLRLHNNGPRSVHHAFVGVIATS